MSADRDAVRPHLVAWSPDDPFAPLTRAVWRPEPVVTSTTSTGALPLTGRTVLVLGPEGPLLDAVAGRLGEAGARVTTDHVGGDADGIVDLGLTGLEHHPGDRRWRPALTRSVEALHAVHERWAAEPRVGQNFYLSVTAADGLLGHGDGGTAGPIAQPLGGIWAGLAKGLRYELPTVAVKTVDLDPALLAEPAGAAAVVAAECATWDHVEVGHRGGVRHTLIGRPETAAPERVRLGAGDTVLITGGGRGIGFALAEGLAARTGCRVVVTGRADLSRPDSVWDLDDAGFARYRSQELRDAAPDLRSARRRLESVAQRRETHRNLGRAHRAGLRVDYAACDCTDRDQVDALVRDVGPDTTVLVHNAGVDQSRRLVDQTPDDVLRTVEVKVEGMLNLVGAFSALPRPRLAVVSGVGSFSGRVGGMVGQVAYSAANDALARLAPWVGAELGVPAQTTVWHSWDSAGGVGGLANPRTALRYTSLVEPADGVRHWMHEILGGGGQEAVFFGRFGSALLPTQVRSLTATALGLADDARWASAHHYLGDVRAFRVHEELRCDARLVEGDHPCLGEFTVAGRPALPVSVLAEYAMTLGDWVTPHGWPRMHLRELVDLEVDLGALALADGELVLHQRASGAWLGADEWAVDVEIRRGDGAGLLTARLVYGATPATIGPVALGPRVSGAGADAAPRTDGAGDRCRWTGHLFRRPARRPIGDGVFEMHPEPVAPADLWARPFPPQVGLAPVFLEEVARGVLPPEATHLRIGRLVVAPRARDLTAIRVGDGSAWSGLTADGAVVVVADDVKAV